MAEHGDRAAKPKSLEELMAEAKLFVEEGNAAPQAAESELPPFKDEIQYPAQVEHRPLPEPLVDLDPAVRLQTSAIAASSFGAAGCFDNEMLLRRAEAIFNYVKNGLE